jgi:nitrite reductase/ring-hydroxylating ferredoxin subunit
MPADSTRLCHCDDVPENESRGFDPWDEGQDSVIVVRKHGSFHAWRDACPHFGGTPMAWRKDAYLNGDASKIVCAAHGAQFDIGSGVCTLGPCLGQALQAVGIVVTAEQEIYMTPDERQGEVQ